MTRGAFGIALAMLVSAGAAQARPVGDFNRDGVVDGQDNVDWIKSFGIQIRTYGVTDEQYNPGTALIRRPGDYAVKMYADECLPPSVSPEQFPPRLVRNLQTVVEGLQEVPLQYLRFLGQRGFKLYFMRAQGRLAKNWWFDTNGDGRAEGVLRIWPAAVSCTNGCPQLSGVLQWKNGPEEALTVSSYNGTAATLVRPGGSVISASIQSNPDLLVGPGFNAWADYGGDAATTVVGSVGTSGCNQTSNEVGTVSKFIALALDNSTHNVVHEMGHFVENALIDNADGPFTAADQSALTAARFNDAVPGCPPDSTWEAPGPAGYISYYAACNRNDNFAETFAYYFDGLSTLQQYAANDPVLFAKMDYLAQVVDHQDPAPVVAQHPTTGGLYAFEVRAGGAVWFNNGSSGWLRPPPGGITREGLAAAAFNNALYVFAIGNDEYLYWMKVASNGQFTTWAREPSGIRPRKGISATATLEQAYVTVTGNDGNLYWTTLNGAESWAPWTYVPTGPRTSLPPTVAACAGKIFFYSVDAGGSVNVNARHPSGYWEGWTMLPFTSRTSVGAACLHGDLRPHAFVVGGDYRLSQDNGGTSTLTELPGNGITTARPSFITGGMSPYDWVFAKGMGDGATWWKQVFSGAWSRY